MLSFEISAIDIVLAIGVMVLLLLYMNKFSVHFPEEKYFKNLAKKEAEQKKVFDNTSVNSMSCPRGYGNIRILSEDNSVSERCLGCYRLMQCYSEDENCVS